jgi:hypothetical protein
MRTLTVQQPWAWAVTHAGQPIVSRTWGTSYRGPLAVRAGSRRVDLVSELIRSSAPRPEELVYGALIATAELTDVHHSSACVRTGRLAHLHPDGPYTCSPWAVGGGGGRYHWRLGNVRVLPDPVPCPGHRDLQELDDVLADAVHAQLGGR